jgi:hypothetical protein
MSRLIAPKFDGPLGILNTTIATSDGIYHVETISLDRAKRLINQYTRIYNIGIDSAVGHESTAQIMTELLEVEISVNRQEFQQQMGQSALVFKLKGRAPEGVILNREEIEKIGYEFKLMTLGRLVD